MTIGKKSIILQVVSNLRGTTLFCSLANDLEEKKKKKDHD